MDCEQCHKENGECLLNYPNMTCSATIPTPEQVYAECESKTDCENGKYCSAYLNCMISLV